MGLTAEVIEVKRVTVDGRELLEVRADCAGHELLGDLYQGGNVDAPPIEGDLVLFVDDGRNGQMTPVGTMDAATAGKAAPGEYRIVGRNAQGAMVSELWMKADGSIRIEPGTKVEIGSAGRLAVVRDGDAVTLGAPITPVPPPAGPLEFWAWVAVVHAAVLALVGPGVIGAVPPTGAAGTVAASAAELETA